MSGSWISKERQGFAQEEFMALDVRKTEEHANRRRSKGRQRILGQTTSEWDATVVFE
jgi:hypothetical protein